MKKSPYKLLVVDIDGTLIKQTGNMSAENREALDMARNTGLELCLSTGRSVKSSLRYIDELSLDGYHIFFDGALVSRPETGEFIHVRYIDKILLKEMIEFASEHNINLELYSTSSYFACRDTWSTEANRRFFGIEAQIRDLTGIWEHEKIVRTQIVTMNPGEASQAQEFISHFTNRIDFTEAHSPSYPETAFINIVSPGVSKGTALEALITYLGISKEEVAAVGDWINDISLLNAAGLGIAMGNAHEELMKVADYVTLDVEENGLAKAIREFVL